MQSLNVHQAPATKAIAPNPKKVKLTFDYNPSQDGVDHNLLVLLHGLGNGIYFFYISFLFIEPFFYIHKCR